MPRKKELQEEYNKAVFEQVEQLRSKRATKYKVRLYTDSYCMAKVAERYYASPKTIERIWREVGRGM